MKIVYIIKAFAMKAGVERVVSDKMNYLVQHGYEVSLVTYEQGSHPHAFPLHPSIRHHSIDARFFKLSQEPIWKRPLRMFQMRRQFKKGLQKVVDCETPDVLITTTYSMKVLDIILNVRTNAHRLIESHIACYTIKKTYDYRHRVLLRPLATLYDRLAFSRIRKFEKLIVLTQGDAEDWSHYIKDVIVIPNPVTCYPETLKSRISNSNRIICVGRLYEQKGFDLLIEAFVRIASQCPEWHIDIFGSGEDKQQLQDSILAHQLEGRINLLPPTDYVYDEYQQSEFYVLSSRYEGYPLVLNEAMSCGLPCVAFRCKYGPEEAITHGKTGLLAKNGDTADLAKQMLWMINHEEERHAMGNAAREAARRYLPQTIMQQWINLFDHLES